MSRPSNELVLTMPLPNPLVLLEATAHFVIQILVAQHPELLAAPDEPPDPSLRPIAHAYLLLTAVRQLQYALEIYRFSLPHGADSLTPDDNFPF